MPDGIIGDAIRVFERSPTGQGVHTISAAKQQQQGDAIYDQKYRDLAKDTTEKLWGLWVANEIGYHQEGDLWGSAAKRAGADIRVTLRLKPDIEKYAMPEEQAKLAGTTLVIVHEAVHMVRAFPVVEEEVLCRHLETVLYHDLFTGVDYVSDVKGRLLEASLSAGTSLVVEELRMEMRDEVQQLRDGRMVDTVLKIPDYRRRLDGGFVRRSIEWWGGPENRLPATRAYYLNALAKDTSGDTPGNVETALRILDSIRARTEWNAIAGALAPGALDKIRALLSHARLTEQHAYRMVRIQTQTGINFGVHAAVV